MKLTNNHYQFCIRIFYIIGIFCLCVVIYNPVTDAMQVNKIYTNKQNTLQSKAIYFMQKSDWKQAMYLAAISKDILLQKIIISQKLLTTKPGLNSFNEYVSFVKHNPNWPQINTIIKNAEHAINSSSDTQLVKSWFKRYKPQTHNGYKYYALSLNIDKSNQAYDRNNIAKIAKEAFIYGNFNKKEEAAFLKKFGQYIHNEDLIKKIDELFWKSDVLGAKKLIASTKNIDSGYKKTFESFVAFLDRKSNAQKIFKQVKDEYKTQALIVQYLKYIKENKQLPLNTKIADYFSILSVNNMHSSEMVKLQLYCAREFLEQNDFKNAYKVMSNNLAITSDDIRDTSWFAGFIALRFLKKPDIALEHFNIFIQSVKTPISLSRGYYWIARSYEAMKNDVQANYYYKLASSYPYAFYGQLALYKLGISKMHLHNISANSKIDTPDTQIVRAGKILMQNNMKHIALIYFKAALEEAKDKNLAISMAEYIKRNTNNIYYSVDFAKSASSYNIFLKDYAFPRPYKIQGMLRNVTKNQVSNNKINYKNIDEAFVYAIIRQESVFDQKALSSANAMGLMQMIDSTASKTAKSIGVKYNKKLLTKDHNYNITLGSAHLNELMQKYNGSHILSAAAYNAGSANVSKWINKFGDPASMGKNINQIIDWIELISYAETRNYVQRVIENLNIYRNIIDQNSKLIYNTWK